MNKVLARIDAYEKLMRLNRPIGILLLLWPTLWALWLAQRGVPNPIVILLFFTGTVLMRSGGCAMNDFADRNFDGKVERTRDRPLARRADPAVGSARGRRRLRARSPSRSSCG